MLNTSTLPPLVPSGSFGSFLRRFECIIRWMFSLFWNEVGSRHFFMGPHSLRFGALWLSLGDATVVGSCSPNGAWPLVFDCMKTFMFYLTIIQLIPFLTDVSNTTLWFQISEMSLEHRSSNESLNHLLTIAPLCSNACDRKTLLLVFCGELTSFVLFLSGKWNKN